MRVSFYVLKGYGGGDDGFVKEFFPSFPFN